MSVLTDIEFMLFYDCIIAIIPKVIKPRNQKSCRYDEYNLVERKRINPYHFQETENLKSLKSKYEKELEQFRYSTNRFSFSLGLQLQYPPSPSAPGKFEQGYRETERHLTI